MRSHNHHHHSSNRIPSSRDRDRPQNNDFKYKGAGTSDRPPALKVDREKSCPFLLRIFYNERISHALSEFEEGKTPAQEFQMYTWNDSTLREISEHLQREVEAARKRDTDLDFSLLYPDFNGGLRRKHLGSVKVGTKGVDDLKTLNQLRFMIGDYMCVAILEPRDSGAGGQQQNTQQQSTSESQTHLRKSYDRKKREDEIDQPKPSRDAPRRDDRGRGGGYYHRENMRDDRQRRDNHSRDRQKSRSRDRHNQRNDERKKRERPESYEKSNDKRKSASSTRNIKKEGDERQVTEGATE